MAEYTKKELSFDELEQVSGGSCFVDGEQQSSLFMQDGTAHDNIGAKVDIALH